MLVKVLFFGMLRDLVGHSEQELELPENACLGSVLTHYTEHFPQLLKMSDSILLAHNQQFATRDSTLADGDEVAMMPPVSGGTKSYTPPAKSLESEQSDTWLACAQDNYGFYGLTRHVIDLEDVKQRVVSTHSGALLTFEGIVRDNSNGRRTLHLDYDCYVPLALQTMQKLGRSTLEATSIQSIAIVHRLGRLQIGESSVVIAGSAAHRQAAYEASLRTIDQLKKIVPVWKKEYFEDGEVWVEGKWDKNLLQNQQ